VGKLPRWLEVVRGEVLKNATPLEVRRQLAGRHNASQHNIAVMSIPEKFVVLQREHEKLKLKTHSVVLAALLDAANAIDPNDLAPIMEKYDKNHTSRDKAIAKKLADLYGGLALLAVNPEADTALTMLRAWSEKFTKPPNMMSNSLFRPVRGLFGTTVATAIHMMAKAETPRMWASWLGPLARHQWCLWQVMLAPGVHEM
jgi:hypothetical protein